MVAVLGEAAPISAIDVVERTAMDKVAVSRAVSGLVEKNLVQQGLDEHDKRRTLLNLTEQGEKIYHAVIPVAQTYENKLMAQLSKPERKQLVALLNKLDTLDISAE